jgi:hypothetical protein
MPRNVYNGKSRAPKFIVENVVEHQSGSGTTEKWDNDIVRQLRGYTKTSEKMKISRHVSEFKFLPLQKYADPFAEMEKYIKAAVKETIEEGVAKLGRVDRIGMELASRMLDWNISLPFSKLTENSVDAFLNRFQLVNVSLIFSKMLIHLNTFRRVKTILCLMMSSNSVSSS